jgi:hypothetical protein
LSTVELDLVEFLDTQVAMLSSSLSYEVSITESPMPNSVACQVIDLQLNLPAVVDAPVAVAPDVVVGSSTPPPLYGSLVPPDHRCRGVLQGRSA